MGSAAYVALRVASISSCAVASVYAAEYINDLGARHWREFATQNYFDRTGVFISLMFSLPIILIALYIVVRVLQLLSGSAQVDDAMPRVMSMG